MSESYESIALRATQDEAYREGLLAAALVCRSQGQDPTRPPCPSRMAAVYIERLAEGEMP
jgi:hypothetical protein